MGAPRPAVQKMSEPNDHTNDFSMSFGDHLEELRRRVLWALAVPLPLAVVLFFAANPLIRMLYRPLDRVLASLGLPRELQVLGPAETIGTQMKLSLIGAAALSAPWILWQAWLFVRPGLYGHEQRFARLLVRFSVFLTAAGLALMYFAMLPLILQILVRFGTGVSSGQALDPRAELVLRTDPEIRIRYQDPALPWPGDVWQVWGREELSVAVSPRDPDAGPDAVEIVRVLPHRGSIIAQQFRLTTYINFVLLLLLGTVVAFQMPLVILLLGWMGVITPAELRARRKHALFITAIVAAVVTPPDALSMILMLVPLYGLYELSIFLMVLMPASAVADGTVWRRLRRWPPFPAARREDAT